MSVFRHGTAAMLALYATSALASEMIAYSYDARGRLTKVSHGGSVNDGLTACYGYDLADNRTNVTVATYYDCSGAPPPPPGLTINDVSVAEGGTLVFTVTKSGATGSSVSVNFATADGTAATGSDYNAASGTLTFAPSETAKTISVVTIDDAAVEADETFSVNLSGASNATINDGVGNGTIVNNDVAPPNLAINDVSVTEGGTLAFTVSRTGSTSTTSTVNFATANGTAAAGSDYNAASGTLTFAPSETAKTVSVVTIDDAAVEADETLSVNLSSASNATISDGVGNGTIVNNDVAAPSFSIGDAAAIEGQLLVFTVTRSGSSSGSYSLSYSTADNTAVAPSDYVAASGTLTFATNEMSKTINITTNTQGPGEGDETMFLNLSAPTGGASISDAQGLGIIYNNTPGSDCYTAPSGQVICD